VLDKSPPLRKSMRHELSLTMSGITGRRPSKVQLNLRHRTSQQFGGVRKRNQTIGEGPIHRSFESAGLLEFAAVAFILEETGQAGNRIQSQLPLLPQHFRLVLHIGERPNGCLLRWKLVLLAVHFKDCIQGQTSGSNTTPSTASLPTHYCH